MKKENNLKMICASMILCAACLLLFFPVDFWGQPFQAVKWPTQYQVNKITTYKTVIRNSAGDTVKEIVVPTNETQRGWIVDGVIQLKQAHDKRGVPVKIVCNYAEQGLPSGEYTVQVLACDANNLCSNPLVTPTIHLAVERERKTTIVRFADDSAGNIVEYVERWKTKVISPEKQEL